MPSKSAKLPVNWSINRGRNDWDIPSEVSPEMSVESLNVDLEKGTLGRKRRGSATQAFSGTYTGYNAIFKFVPGQDDTAAETIFVDLTGTTKIMRVAAGTTATALTLTDAVATAPHLVRAAVLNAKIFFAYDSTVNRLHVFDPATSTTALRRAGLDTPAAPTISDQGSGTYATAARYYRVVGQVKDGSGNLLRQSNLGAASTVFTPNTTSQYARVTAPSWTEGETHWVVFASADDASYYDISGSIVVATTTYDDDDDPADYDTNEPAPDEGTYTPFPSVKMLLSTGDRLLGFGVWETSAGDSMAPYSGRVYFTPALNSTDAQDDERINNTIDFQGWIDINRNGGAEDRALAGPMDSMVFVFQSRGVWSLVPSGVATVPYRRVPLRDDIGAVSQESTFMGEDDGGRPCIYFLDPIRGPYRYGPRGWQWVGYDIQTLWATVNLTANVRVAAGVWDPERRACVFGIATGSANVITKFATFYAREGRTDPETGDVRGGWAVHSGPDDWTFRCMAVLPESYGATMARTLKVYAGNSTVLNRYNDESVQQDAGVSFQAYVQSGSADQGALQLRKQLQKAYLQASAGSGVTITLTMINTFGKETNRTSTVSLTASAAGESRVVRKFEDAALMDAESMQFRLGDAATANNAWTLDEFVAQLEVMDEA